MAYFKSIASVDIPIANVSIGFLSIFAAIAQTSDESKPPDSKKPNGASASNLFSTPLISNFFIFWQAVSTSS